MSVNAMDYSSKDIVLDIMRNEAEGFFKAIDDPRNWHVQTRCTEWEVRDVVGHMIDVTEGYLSRWEIASKGDTAGAHGLSVMGELLNTNALSFRSLSREEAITRLKAAYEKMMTIFKNLTVEEWGGFNVPHPYMGPLPTLFYPAFQIIDYSVHTWDIRWGLGEKDASLDEFTAGTFIPYMFIVLQSTIDQVTAKDVDAVIGIKIDGELGGQWRATIKDGTLQYAPAENLDDVQSVFYYKNASDFVLTTFQRIQAWKATGNQRVIDQVSKLFFKI